MILLDSSAWVELFSASDKGKKVEEFMNSQKVLTSIIAIAELADKFERDGKETSTAFMIINNSATILPISPEIAIRAGKLKNQIRKTKPKFGLFDALHYATAEQQNATFVTADHDFSGLKNVMIL
ncbi:MAG TPA: PIN domain-containing protein [Candidatus Nanoarchaeia archaeon]|nr:PIN domain-containing protein [Candidatus Nanoarchaeia archaeon]